METERDEKSEIRWLHLSDLHFAVNVNDAMLREALLAEIEKVLPVDCIVITGDIFDHGDWSTKIYKEKKDTLTEFITNLYKCCSEKGEWNWIEGQPMDRLFFCPGNHDVYEGASLFDDTDGNIKRSDAIASVLQNMNDNDYVFPFKPDADNIEKRVLIDESFRIFYSTMKSITNIDIPSGECQSHVFGFKDGNTHTPLMKLSFSQQGTSLVVPIFFCGLNTAILVGQRKSAGTMNGELKEKYNDAQNALASDTVNALDKVKDYIDLYCKSNGITTTDEGNLCFPFSTSSMTQQINKDSPLANAVMIHFGHHPLNHIKYNAIPQLPLMLQQNTNYIYLCGHSHKICSEEIALNTKHPALPSGKKIYMYQLGGVFADESDYNQWGFAIGTLKLHPNESKQLVITASVTVHTCLKGPLSQKWKYIPDQDIKEVEVFQQLSSLSNNDDNNGGNPDNASVSEHDDDLKIVEPLSDNSESPDRTNGMQVLNDSICEMKNDERTSKLDKLRKINGIWRDYHEQQ